MVFEKTKIAGVWLISLEPFADERGFFARNFAREEFLKQGITFDIVHVNRSLNKIKGTTRGFHYQSPPRAEDKLMQCIRGKIYIVVLDLRKKSETYLQWVSEELTPEKKNMIIVPKGCANAIQTLADDSELQYFVTEVYSPQYERGLRWNDPFLKVQWPVQVPAVISDKDARWQLIDETSPPCVEL